MGPTLVSIYNSNNSIPVGRRTITLTPHPEIETASVKKLLYWNAIAALACLVSAIAGLVLAPAMDNVAAVWPATGMALAALLVCGNRVIPGVLVANLAITALLHLPAPVALTIAAAATIGPLVTGFILRRLKLDLSLGSVRDAVRYCAVACPLAIIATPALGVVALAAGGSLSWKNAPDLWEVWATTDCLSVLVVTPLLLSLHGPVLVERRPNRSMELLLSAALLLAVTLFCYSLSPPVGYPVLLAVMLIAVRNSQREVAVAVLGVVTVALLEVMYRDFLPITATAPSIPRVLDFFVFLGAGSLLLGSLVAENRRKDALLLRANQDRLKQSEMRFEDAFESSPQGMAITGPDGRFLRVNTALCQLIGYSEAELLAKNFQSVTHPDDVGQNQAVMQALLAGEVGNSQFEKRYIHRSGKIVIVLLSVSLVRDANGMPLHCVVQAMDVTDRKRAEELWRFGLENAGDVVWDWDIPSETLILSGKVRELLGYAPGQVPQSVTGWREIIHPDDAADVMTKVTALLEVPGYPYAAEYRIRGGDGLYKWVLSRGLVMSWDRDDKPIRAVGTFADVSEVQRLQEKLHQSDKMAALGQLSGGVAHDVNNDLGVIVGSAELILERAEPGSREEILSSRIISTVRRSMDLVRRMLAFSRQAEIAPEPLELSEFLKGFIDTMGRTLGAHIQARVHTADPKAAYWVSLDRGMLESSLINLSINARDAMPNGGVLTLSLAIEPGKKGEPGTILLTVGDTGTGMTEAVQRRIFEPFFTTKPAGGGTGLGLAMVYGFVQQSGGRIDVESKLGAGTRFLLRFPAATPSKQPRNEAPLVSSSACTVLLVDDNATLRLTLREQLASLNCTVEEAASYEEALAVLRAGKAIDFILSDLDLGSGPDGVALAQWAQQNGHGGPGAIISGHLKSLTGLPANWQSVQKPIQLADLKLMLAASNNRGAQAKAVESSAILVVEDNEDMRFIATEFLKRGGHHTLEAASAQEALRKLNNDATIRLVLCDVELPDMSGIMLTEEIRRLRPKIGVVLMSGNVSQHAAGGRQMLQKPFTRESLMRAVDEVLARHPA